MFSGSIGLAGWFGNLPSSSKYSGTTSHGSRSKTCGTVSPAMPLPASIAILNGLIFATVDEREAVLGELVEDVAVRDRAAACGGRRKIAGDQAGRGSRRGRFRARSRAPRERVNFMPLYWAGLCDAVIMTPPSKPYLPTAK